MYVFVGMLLIGALLFAVWRMSGPDSPSAGPRTGGSAQPTHPPARKPTRGHPPLGPDDNPEFLRELNRRAREQDPPT